MSEVHLSNDAFLERLAQLFDERRNKDHGSIFLTQKCMTFGETSDPHPGQDLSGPLRDPLSFGSLPIIIRATSGKSKAKKEGKIKLTTIVKFDRLETFFLKYADVCKNGMSGLKKRDRSKGKKKMKAKKKKGVAGFSL